MRGFSRVINFRRLYLLKADVKLTEVIQIISSTVCSSNCSNQSTQHFSTDINQRISWESSSYEPLLKKLETVLVDESIDEIWEAFSNYKQLHGFPDARLVNGIIVKLSYSSEQHWLQKAYSLVLMILEEKPYLLHHNTLIRLALTLARAQMPVFASTIMRITLEKFKLPNIDTWNILILNLVKSQIGSYLASEILIEICEYRLHRILICKNSKQKMKVITPSTIMFNFVLNSCLHYGSLLKAQQIIELMPQSGVTADANTVVIIAQIYELLGQRNELKKLQVHIDDVSSVSLKRHYHKFYDSLLNLHFKFNDFDAAGELVLGLFKQPKSGESSSLKQCMLQVGSSNLRSGSTILVHQNELQRDQDFDTYGLTELVRFIDGKLVPSAKVFAKLVNGFVKDNNVNKLSGLLIAIQKETGLIRSSLCLDVINSCIQQGWLKTAHDIIDDLESAAIPLEADIYNTLLKAYKKNKIVGEYKILERQLKKAGHFVSQSDDDVINQKSTLVEHLDEEAKNESKASFLVYEFNTSIQFFCRANMMDDAMTTFKRMQEMNIQPTVQTFSYLVNGYSSLQLYRQITILWGDIRRRLEDELLVADRDLFDILLLNFLKGGYFERVMDVVNYMLKHNMFVDKWKYKTEFLKLHKDLYRNLNASEARTDAQSKRLQYVRAFRSWVGIHQKRLDNINLFSECYLKNDVEAVWKVTSKGIIYYLLLTEFWVMEEKYEPIELNLRNFDVVRLVKDRKTEELLAVKYIERGETINEKVLREIINHSSLKHPNILCFNEVWLTPTHLAIVMEYAARGELYKRIRSVGRFNEDEARFYFQQLISGVSYCHSMEICRRDLNLENTLLGGTTTPCLKLGLLHSQTEYMVRVPPGYMAPEVLSRKEYDGKIADVWSCGVTLCMMLVGSYPFEDPDDSRNFREAVRRILSVQYPIPDHVRISVECRELLSKIFVADPSQRITIPEIKKHPWFLKNLPEGMGDSDELYRESKKPSQTVEEIMKIVQEAKTPALGTNME